VLKILSVLCLFLSLSSQTQRVIALRVQFQIDDSEYTTGNGHFDLRTTMPMDSVESIAIDPPPHNKAYFEDHLLFAKNYFNQTLNVQLEYNVYPNATNSAFQLSKKMFAYNPNTETDSLKGVVQLYEEAYTLAENAGVNIAESDIVIVFHAGVGNDIFKEVNYTPHDIPSISLSKRLFEKYTPSWLGTGRSIKGIILPETASQEGLQLAINGLVVANIGTQLGLLDLVDPVEKRTVVGPWALEDRGLFNAAGLLPSAPSAFNKAWYNGTLQNLTETSVFSAEQSLSLTHAANQLSVLPKMIKIPLNATEYLLVEQRFRPVYNNDRLLSLDQLIPKLTDINQPYLNYKQVLTHPDFSHRNSFTFSPRGVLIEAENFDAAIPHSGIAIWHVDQRQLDRFAASNAINGNATRRTVRFLEADGVDNYSTGGDGINDERYDVFYAENDVRYYQNAIDSRSFPSTNSNYEFAKSGLKLSDFSTIGDAMSFKVKREGVISIPFTEPIFSVFQILQVVHVLTATADSLFIYRKNVGVEQFHRSAHAHNVGQVLKANLHALQAVLATQSALYYFNINGNFEYTEPLSSPVHYFVGEDVYVDEDKNLYRGIPSFTLAASNVDTAYYSEGELYVHSNGRLKILKNHVLTDLQAAKDGVLTFSDEIFATEINQNSLYAFYSNGTLRENSPITIPYRHMSQQLNFFEQVKDYILTVDKLGLIKVTAAAAANQNNYASYAGFQPERLFLNTVYETIIATGSQHYFEEKISLPDIGKAPRKLAESKLTKQNTYLWPNPNKGSEMNLRIPALSKKAVKIRIFTENGLLVNTIEAEANASAPVDVALPVSSMANGTYLIQISNDGESILKKAAVIH
jgi:hypothetical protein